MEVLLLSAALVTLAILGWAIYGLNVRMMRLESDPNRIHQFLGSSETVNVPPQTVMASNDLFQGLIGEPLFHAMAGESDSILVFEDDARKRFELIIRKHILAILDQVKEGNTSISNESMIRTLRGEILSWLPQETVTAIIHDGQKLALDPTDSVSIYQINQTVSSLYERLSLETPGDFLEVEEEPEPAESEQFDEGHSSEDNIKQAAPT